MDKKIHFETKPHNILCKNTITFAKHFTNDIDSCTCKKCRYIYKLMELDKIKSSNENKNLREVLNKKSYHFDELDNIMNHFDNGYEEM